MSTFPRGGTFFKMYCHPNGKILSTIELHCIDGRLLLCPLSSRNNTFKSCYFCRQELLDRRAARHLRKQQLAKRRTAASQVKLPTKQWMTEFRTSKFCQNPNGREFRLWTYLNVFNPNKIVQNVVLVQVWLGLLAFRNWTMVRFPNVWRPNPSHLFKNQTSLEFGRLLYIFPKQISGWI